MILNALRKPPIISFGLSMTMLSCSPDQLVTVYCNDVLNPNELVIVQQEVVKMVYRTLPSGPDVLFELFFTKQGNHNDRAYFTAQFNETVEFAIFWDGFQWRIATDFDPNTGEFGELISRLFEDIELPYSDQWVGTSPIFLIVVEETSQEIIGQAFTFPAIESKDIEIELRNKRTGELMKSNKIQLIIEPPSS
jgi:hypothetical protein